MANFIALAAMVVATLAVAAGFTGAFTTQYKQKDNGASHLYLYQSCNAKTGECDTYDKPADDACDRGVYDRFTAAFAFALIGSVLSVAVVIISCVGICKRTPGAIGAVICAITSACFIIAFSIVADLFFMEFCETDVIGQATKYSNSYDFDLGFPFLIVAAGLSLICMLLHCRYCLGAPV